MVQNVAGRSRRRFRLGVGAVGAVSAVAGVLAAVGLGGWEITEHNGPESTLPAIESAPSPVKPTPPVPPEAMLNGSYRLTLEDSQSKYVRSTAADWSAGSVDYVGYIQFSTKCIGSECVATSSPTTDPTSPALGKTVETMVWTSGRWSSRQRPMPDGDGTDESSTILRSDGHRGFLGMTTDTIISGPHTGAQLSAPVVLTPTFDPANL